MSHLRHRVFFNGRFLTQPITGVQRAAREIIGALDSLLLNGEVDDQEWDICLLTPRDANINLTLHRLPVVRVGRMRGHAWEQLDLPRYARGASLVSFANTGPLLTRDQIVLIHDASVFTVPSAYSSPFRLWYQFLIPRLGRKAAVVLTVSGFSSRELSRFAKISPSKLRVVPHGKEHILGVMPDVSIIERAGIGDCPFVLAVGSRSPHKNFQAIVQAMEILGEVPYNFVLAGGINTRVFGGSLMNGSSRVRALGYVSDRELRALYERAGCFIFPSIYEGFGLPPLEAMACGCPVIASHAASLPEVCGDAAVYFDPADPAALARQIAEVMSNATLRVDLSRRGLERAERYSWRESARGVMRALEEVVPR